MDFSQIVVWVEKENWFVIVFTVVGALNVVIAGAKAMGWTAMADACQRIENAIQAMVTAAKSSLFSLTQKKG